MLKNIKLGKGVLQTLKKLKKRGLQIAIVSDLTTKIQLRKLKALKISEYIDVLVTSEEAGSEKPHLIMFLLALNKLALTPKDVLMVGDNSIADIEGANSARIDTVLIKKGKLSKGRKEDYQKANYTIKEIPEIVELLNKIESDR
jgi:putative hydrolase of the HAD superfamily